MSTKLRKLERGRASKGLYSVEKMISTVGTGGVRISSYLRLPYTAETPLLLPNVLFFRRCSRRFFTSCSASSTKQKVIVISGPTGAGKSKLALELAKRLNGEIISADSIQVLSYLTHSTLYY